MVPPGGSAFTCVDWRVLDALWVELGTRGNLVWCPFVVFSSSDGPGDESEVGGSGLANRA